jgi:hypothetical protein
LEIVAASSKGQEEVEGWDVDGVEVVPRMVVPAASEEAGEDVDDELEDEVYP